VGSNTSVDLVTTDLVSYTITVYGPAPDYKELYASGSLTLPQTECLVIKPPVTPPPPVCENLPGAIFTTDKDGNRVNQNIYDAKTDVYLQGGPDKQGAHLPDGTYYYRVTDPSGKNVLSATRSVTVKDGVFPSTQLAPFQDTPNNGGEYKVWLSTSSDFTNKCTKTDNFKVKAETPPPTDKEFTVNYGPQTCVPGANNDTVGSPSVSPKEAAQVNEGSWSNGKLTKSVTANEGYKPAAGTDLSKDYTDNGGNWGTPPPPTDKEFTVNYGPQTCVPGFGPNGTFNDGVTSPVVSPAEAASLASSINGKTLTQSVTPNKGYKPKTGTVLEQTYTDAGDNCGTPPPPPTHVKVIEITNHSGQNCTKTWTWHTTTTKVDGKVVSVKDSNKVYKAKAANTCTTPTKHVVPGSGAPHTGGAGDGNSRNGLAALAFALVAALAGAGFVSRRRLALNA
jgi:hypothetical protein